MKKAISLFLVFSILLLSGNLFAKERKGADLIIQKKDGQQVRGELIAVKKSSLLLLERESGADVTVDVGDIGIITVVKKSQVVLGAVLGSLLGFGIGAAIGAGEDDPNGFMRGYGTSIGGGIGASAGLLLGGIVGVALGTDKTIQFTGKSDSEIQEILEKLRKKARVRNAL